MHLFLGVMFATFYKICGSVSTSEEVANAFISSELVPDILPIPPDSLLYAKYSSGAEVLEGNVLSITDVVIPPLVKWGAVKGVYYIVILIDPDTPSRNNHVGRSFLYWMVVNAQNDDVTSGDTVAFYIPPAPTPGSGYHRLTLLVFRQPSYLPAVDFASYETVGSLIFTPVQFSDIYDLGNPVAGNYFLIEITDVKVI